MQSSLSLVLLALDERMRELCVVKIKFYLCDYDVCFGFTLPFSLFISPIFFKGSIGPNPINLALCFYVVC